MEVVQDMDEEGYVTEFVDSIGTCVMYKGRISHQFLPLDINVHRSTQISLKNSKAQSALRNAATQMSKQGVYISTNGDHERFVDFVYQSADELDRLRHLTAIMILKHMRRYLSKKRVLKLLMNRKTKMLMWS